GRVAHAAEQVAQFSVNVCTVIGSRTGAHTPESKAFEASQAIAHGVDELHMGIKQAAALSADTELQVAEITDVVTTKQEHEVIVKVSLEPAALTYQAKILACEAAVAAGADFVKPSTGFGSGGATVEDVALMRQTVSDQAGVKASGGIRTRQDALHLLKAGAKRHSSSYTYAMVS